MSTVGGEKLGDVVGDGTETARPFSFSPEPTLEDIRCLHAEFAAERDWDQFHQPRNLLLALVGEVGELAELLPGPSQLPSPADLILLNCPLLEGEGFSEEVTSELRPGQQEEASHGKAWEEQGEHDLRQWEHQWKPDGEPGPQAWPPKERAALQEELSDVLIYLVALAARCRVDLPQAVLSKMDTNRRRYPAHLSRGSSRKYTDLPHGVTSEDQTVGTADLACESTGQAST